MVNSKEIHEIEMIIDKILVDKYFNNNIFEKDIKKLISYKEEIYYIGGTETLSQQGTKKDIYFFYDLILSEIYLKILSRMRNNIINNKKKLERIQNDYSINKIYKSIFLFKEDELIDVISNCCKKSVINKFKEVCKEDYKDKIRDNFSFVENFHKDNAVLKLLAISLKESNIIKKAFDLEDPEYEIELKYRNNVIYNAGTLKNKRLNKFKDLYLNLKYLCEKNVIKNNKNINKWLSIYEVNEISKCINIVNIGEYRITIEDLKARDEKFKKYGVGYYSFDEEYEMKIKKLLLENKVIILNYLLENYPIIDKLFEIEEKESYITLKYVFDIIDQVSEEILKFIESKKSLELELKVISEYNNRLIDKQYNCIFKTKLKNNIGRGIIEMYNINLKL